MKKFLSLAMCIIALFSTSLSTYASTPNQVVLPQKEEIVENSDGTYVIITTEVGNEVNLRDGRSSRIATRTFTYKNRSGSTLWTFTLNASFSYNGSSCSAQGASTTYSIKNNSWSCDDRSSRCSGNTAYGTGWFSSSSESKTANLSLSCDKNGNIR